MKRIEDELRSAAQDLHDRLGPERVEAGLDRVRRAEGHAARSRWPLALAAAALVAVAGIAGVVAAVAGGDDVRTVAPSGGAPATTTSTGPEATTTSTVPTGATVEPSAPDLAPAWPNHEITFDGIGQLQVGQGRMDRDVVPHTEGSSCGYWSTVLLVNDRPPPTALYVGLDTLSPRVVEVEIHENPNYRTASGIGVGTRLTTIQRIYGDDLVVDRADGWESPTDGLLASYQDVAAVRRGDRAITYLVREDVVEAVEVATAGNWGDDEGCA